MNDEPTVAEVLAELDGLDRFYLLRAEALVDGLAAAARHALDRALGVADPPTLIEPAV